MVYKRLNKFSVCFDSKLRVTTEHKGEVRPRLVCIIFLLSVTRLIYLLEGLRFLVYGLCVHTCFLALVEDLTTASK